MATFVDQNGQHPAKSCVACQQRYMIVGGAVPAVALVLLLQMPLARTERFAPAEGKNPGQACECSKLSRFPSKQEGKRGLRSKLRYCWESPPRASRMVELSMQLVRAADRKKNGTVTAQNPGPELASLHGDVVMAWDSCCWRWWKKRLRWRSTCT